MALNNYSAELKICEGETQQFDIMEMIGYDLTLNPVVWKIYFADGSEVPADSYITKVDGDTIEIDLSSMPDFNGEIPFRIVGYDDSKAVFDISVNTTVMPVNDAPEGTDASASLAEDGSYAFEADDFGFSDPVEGDAFQAVVVSSLPANGQLLLDGVAVAAGQTVSVADIEAGKFVFVPDAGYNGTTGFDFQVQDDGGVDSDCGGTDTDPTPNSFTLTVTPVNDVPVAVDDSYTTDDGVLVTGSLANNDTPSEDGGNVWSKTSEPAHGTVTVNPDGTFSYQPEPGFVGTDAFTYQIIDADGSIATATATITIEGLQTAILGDKVWIDGDGDGLQDGTEAGVAGVEVTLHGAGTDGVFGTADDTTETTTTNADGLYYFEGIVGQEYYVTVEAPANYVFTQQDVNFNGNDDIDSDTDAAGVSGTFIVSGVEDNLHVDAGLIYQGGSIAGTVLADTDDNTTGDTPLGGVTVVLLDTNGNEVGSTTTNPDGSYVFTDVPAGDYTVVQTNLPGYEDVSDADGGNPNEIAVTVAPGASSSGNDFVDAPQPASLGDTVWYDNNGNGLQDGGEAGVAGVTVTLTGAGTDGVFGTGDDVTLTDVTDANGNYLFEDLAAGDYKISVDAPEGYDFTTANAGSDETTDSDVSSTGQSDVVSLSLGEDYRDLDAGIVAQPGSIAGTVLADTDGNTTGDTPLGGVTVVLLDANGNEVGSTTTNPDGTYLFADVPAGDYTVVQTNLPGYEDVSDTDGGNPNEISVSLAPGAESTGNDFVDAPMAGSIAGNVSADLDDNDTGDVPLEGVVVKLIDANGNEVATTTTDASGNYVFNDVAPGQYSVMETNPAGYDDVSDTDGGDPNMIAVDLAPGESSTGNDFVDEPQPGSIAGTVLADTDDNTTGDTPLGGVTVVLLDTNGNEVGSTTTNPDGSYVFTDVPAGDYTVVQTNLPGYEDVSDADGGNPNEIAVTVAPGASSSGNDFVDAPQPASLGDTVWYDNNGNGLQDGGEAGVAGVTVTLTGAGTDGVFGTGDDVTLTDVTDANGNYLFEDLAAGDYKISVDAPEGYDFTTANAGSDETTDSDVSSTGQSDVVSLSLGEDYRDLDAGIVAQPGSIAGTVLADTDGNTTGDTPLGGVTVVLLDANGNEVGSTTTNPDGTYLFADVPAGDYTVVQTNLPGYEDVSDTDGGNPNEISVSLAPGAESTGNDFVDAPMAGSIAGNVSADLDDNDTGDVPLEGVVVKLIDANGNEVATTTTDASGNYVFNDVAPGQYSVMETNPAGYDDVSDTDGGDPNMIAVDLAPGESSTGNDFVDEPQPGSIAGTVLADTDDNTTGDTPLAGVVVTLLDANGVAVASTTTGADGTYLFAGVPAGQYTVVETTPAGYNDVSDTDGGDPNTISVNLLPGMTSANNDFVDAPMSASVGDTVWLDANGNGVQDGGEAGVAGVSVTLIGGGADGVIGTADDTTTSQTTDANGNYLFDNLTPGTEYQVQFSDLPTGYKLTGKDVGGDDTVDSDADASTGLTDVFTLANGEDRTDVDAGVKECTVTLGDTIWNDDNGNGLQDSGEAGVAGVKLTLVGAGADGQFGTADDTSATTTTDANGNYAFENVVWGDYKIQMTVPEGYELTTANMGGDDSKDSDFLFFSSKSTTNLIVNGSFEDPNCDWGMYDSVTGWKGLGDKIEIGRTHHFGVTGATGQNVLELDANKTCVDGNGVYQDVQTSNGQQYELSLDVAARNCTDLASNVIEVWWAGEKVATIAPTTTELTTYTFTVEGTGSLDRLELREAAGTDDSVGGIIDNVTLYAFDSVVETGVISVNSCADDLTIDGGLVEGNTCIMTCEDKSVTFTVDLADGQTVMSFTQTAHGTIVDNGDGSFTYTPATNYNGNDGFSYTVGTVEYVDSTESIFICNASFEDKSLSNDCTSASIPGWATGNSWWTTDSKTWNPGKYEGGIVSDGYNVASVGTKGISQTLGEKFVEGVKYELKVDVGNLGSTSKDDNTALVKVYAGNTLIACLTASDLGSVSKDGFKTATLSFEGTGFSAKDCVYGEKLTIVLDSTCVTYYDNVRLTKTTTTTTTVEGDTFDVCIDVKPVNDAPDGADKTVTVDGTRVYTVAVDDFGFSDIDGDDFKSVIIDTLPGAGALTLDGVAVSAGQTISVADIADGKLVFTGSGSKDAAITFRVQDDGGVDAQCGGVDTDVKANTLCFDLPESYGQIGDRVWIDADCDGIQDAGEKGAACVTVKLLDSTGCVIATTTTDDNGYYLFDKVQPGTYQVKVVTPDGYKVTTKDAAGSTWENDSDANDKGLTDTFTLGDGQVIDSIDVGLCSTKACIGNRVWEDANHNSIQDKGELGIGGIKVTLYGWNGYCDYKIATTTTDANGNYKFDGVNAGWYYVAFDKSNVWHQASWGSWANMSNWNWGYKDVGSDDSKDSDVHRKDGDCTTTDWTWVDAGDCNLSLDAAITPIVIDLDGDGIETVARDAAGGTFDLFGNGQAIASGWVGADDGMLAIDLNGNGIIDGISELFGGSQKGDGFAKLASFDSNADGVVDANDADFAKLSIWQDANGNHATDAGELMSLTEAGVASLTVAYEELPFMDAQGNLHLERSSATLADGTSVDMTDVYFNVSQADADVAGVDLSSMADLLDMGGSLDVLLGASATSDVSMSSFDGMEAGADISAMTQMAYLYEQAAA